MRWRFGMTASVLAVSLLASCKAGPSAKGAQPSESASAWELKGSRLVGCCCSPPCS
ncbi:MAG: hypothetical protein HY716_17715 [Planctomycetes bacterium]|nr:hypothetical protein [Planctomycetota bacterium]